MCVLRPVAHRRTRGPPRSRPYLLLVYIEENDVNARGNGKIDRATRGFLRRARDVHTYTRTHVDIRLARRSKKSRKSASRARDKRPIRYNPIIFATAIDDARSSSSPPPPSRESAAPKRRELRERSALDTRRNSETRFRVVLSKSKSESCMFPWREHVERVRRDMTGDYTLHPGEMIELSQIVGSSLSGRGETDAGQRG